MDWAVNIPNFNKLNKEKLISLVITEFALQPMFYDLRKFVNLKSVLFERRHYYNERYIDILLPKNIEHVDLTMDGMNLKNLNQLNPQTLKKLHIQIHYDINLSKFVNLNDIYIRGSGYVTLSKNRVYNKVELDEDTEAIYV